MIALMHMQCWLILYLGDQFSTPRDMSTLFMMRAYLVTSHRDAVIVSSGITETEGHKVDCHDSSGDGVKVTVVTVPLMLLPIIWH